MTFPSAHRVVCKSTLVILTLALSIACTTLLAPIAVADAPRSEPAVTEPGLAILRVGTGAESAQPGTWQATNQGVHLRALFAADRVQLLPETTSQADWSANMHFTGFGYASQLLPAAAATLAASGNRIVYTRAGLTEWFENSESGLVHGFTIQAAPPGEPTKEVVVLRFEVTLTGDVV